MSTSAHSVKLTSTLPLRWKTTDEAVFKTEWSIISIYICATVRDKENWNRKMCKNNFSILSFESSWKLLMYLRCKSNGRLCLCSPNIWKKHHPPTRTFCIVMESVMSDRAGHSRAEANVGPSCVVGSNWTEPVTRSLKKKNEACKRSKVSLQQSTPSACHAIAKKNPEITFLIWSQCTCNKKASPRKCCREQITARS